MYFSAKIFERLSNGIPALLAASGKNCIYCCTTSFCIEPVVVVIVIVVAIVDSLAVVGAAVELLPLLLLLHRNDFTLFGNFNSIPGYSFATTGAAAPVAATSATTAVRTEAHNSCCMQQQHI